MQGVIYQQKPNSECHDNQITKVNEDILFPILIALYGLQRENLLWLWLQYSLKNMTFGQGLWIFSVKHLWNRSILSSSEPAFHLSQPHYLCNSHPVSIRHLHQSSRNVVIYSHFGFSIQLIPIL